MPETVGQRLRQAREYRHLTLEKASDATRIRRKFLQALESDDFSGMTSAAQARGFLRNYAEFLGLDLDQAVEDLQKAIPAAPASLTGPLPQVDLNASALQSVQVSEERPWWRSFLESWLLRGQESPPDPNATVPEREQDVAPPPAGVDSTLRDDTVVEQQPSHPLRQMKGSAKKVTRKASGAAREPDSRRLEPSASRVDPAELTNESKPGGDLPETPAETRRSNWLKSLASVFKLRVSRTKPSMADGTEADRDHVADVQTSLDPVTTPPESLADEIFSEIGIELRTRRELLSLTADEIERHIHVRASFLKAIEAGAFDQLPSPVQTRGMLANYAAFLDLDTDRLMLRFADGLQARHRQKYPAKQRAPGSMEASPALPPLRSFVAADLLFGIGVAAVLLVLALWGVGRILNPPAAQPRIQSTAPSISEVLAGTSRPRLPEEVSVIPALDTPLPAAAEGNEQELALPTFSGTGSVQVSVVAVERAFMRVQVDGEEVFNGRVLPGTAYPFEAEHQIEILTGNGAALRVTFNGRDLGFMGNLGEVVSTIYTASGIATATATLPPTPTLTPNVTVTPTATITPTSTGAPPALAP